MNATSQSPELIQIDNETDIESEQRRSAFSLDELYIQEFCKNPAAGKSAALKAAGFTGGYTRQQAHVMHKRLRSRIEAKLLERMTDAGHLGHAVACELAIKAENDSTRLQAAKVLLEYSGFKPPERLAIEVENMSDEAIEGEIVAIQKRIREREAGAPL